MKKLLIIISSVYPYRKSEDYLSNEIAYIKGFEKIICFPTTVYGKKNNKDIVNYPIPPENISFYNSLYSFKQKLIPCFWYIVTHKFLYNELFKIINQPTNLLPKIKNLLRTTLQATHSYLDIKNIIQRINNKQEYEIYLYSYWMVNTALTTVLLDKDHDIKIKKTFTRCHRFDLYEEANDIKYIPYRQYILSNINRIYAISDDAKTYLEKKYSQFVSQKIQISRLGTFDHGINISPKEINILRLVSCSWLRPVKRVHLIFEALNEINIPIEWTHFGDGEEMFELQQKIKYTKNKNLSINLLGYVTNSDILKFYSQNNYNVFINVSESEGVPVSIMEAMSFGKIIIATNVGGTSEVVLNEKNGYLLNKDFQLNELKKAIITIYNMNNSDYEKMCYASRRIWEERCNAQLNYETFYKEISK